MTIGKTQILSALFLVSAFGSATAEDDWRSNCSSVAGLAEVIMQNRQSGVSMVKMMEAPATSELKDLVESLIISAYDSPRYSTEKMQQRSVEEFRDEVYLQCVKSQRDN